MDCDYYHLDAPLPFCVVRYSQRINRLPTIDRTGHPMTNADRREFLGGATALALSLATGSRASTSTAGAETPAPARVGIVARGRQGRAVANHFLESQVVEVVEVAGVRTRKTLKRGNSNWKRTAERLLLDDRIDSVAISVPGRWSMDFAGRAILAGKHVYLEALRGYSVAELQRNVAAAATMHRSFFLPTPSRSSEALVEAAECVREGAIGSVRYARAICVRPHTSTDAELAFGSAPWNLRILRALDLAAVGSEFAGALPAVSVRSAHAFESSRGPSSLLPESLVAEILIGNRRILLEHSGVAGSKIDGLSVGAIVVGSEGRLWTDGSTVTICDNRGKLVRTLKSAPNPAAAFAASTHRTSGSESFVSPIALHRLARDLGRLEWEYSGFDGASQGLASAQFVETVNALRLRSEAVGSDILRHARKFA